MLELFDVSYEDLKKTYSDELYRLRKQTFSDRLGWEVECNQGMEYDEFDNSDTRYILGIYDGQIICSVRFVSLALPNMITHTFNTCFNDISLPLNGIESSRFFVDKNRARQLLGESFPVSRTLFLAMINYANKNNFDGIYTIVSRPMLAILKRSGWKIQPLKEAYLRPQERIYLLFLPTEKDSQIHMAAGIKTSPGNALDTWPLNIPVAISQL